MSPSFDHLIRPTTQVLDERRYNHMVRVKPVIHGTPEAMYRHNFYPDNGLRWFNNKRSLCDDGRVEYGFPDEAVARKFAARFGGEYFGTD